MSIAGIDSLNLQALSAYSKVDNTHIANKSSHANATQFQELVKAGFNNLAEMTPDQRIDYITAAKTRATPVDRVTIGTAAQALGSSLRHHEDITQKSLTGEASLQDLMVATTEARNALSTATALRDKFLAFLDKIMNMQV